MTDGNTIRSFDIYQSGRDATITESSIRFSDSGTNLELSGTYSAGVKETAENISILAEKGTTGSIQAENEDDRVLQPKTGKNRAR